MKSVFPYLLSVFCTITFFAQTIENLELKLPLQDNYVIVSIDKLNKISENQNKTSFDKFFSRSIINKSNLKEAKDKLSTTYNNNLDTFKIKPNPAVSGFTIELPKRFGTKKIKIEVFDMLGKLIYNSELSKVSTSIIVTDWSTGAYIVKLSYKDQVVAKRLIKK